MTAPSNTHAYFFGYGSLVNRDTHAFASAHTAQLTGWRRVWRHTILRPAAYLSVIPDPTCQIDGLVAAVPDQDWAALDKREGAYSRIAATHQISHSLPDTSDIVLYAISKGKHGDPNGPCYIPLSYIDVVIQGYLREFGASGATRFFQTTDGWDTPVLDDRSNPIYPRHQSLSPDETTFVDDSLSDLSVSVTRS